jgi:hypothetical protein
MRAKDNWLDELFECLGFRFGYVTEFLVLPKIQLTESERKIIKNCVEMIV